jgi:nucleotide-binding universal stress UspA family protein
MGTIFVAYGGENRAAVLETAINRAHADGHDLYVYHVLERESVRRNVRDEIHSVIERPDPTVVVDIEIDRADSHPADDGEPSKENLLRTALRTGDSDYEYVVMGDIDRGTIEGFIHASMTEAALEEAACPVMLVPSME